MNGIVKLHIHNNKVDYKLTLNRNITIIKGKSATGKTTLYKLVAEYMHKKMGSGVKITCTSGNGCIALNSVDWQHQLKMTKNSVVFIDEGFIGFENNILANEFVRIIKKTDNYYVIFNRDDFIKIPSSVEEIYEIETIKSKHILNKYYKINNSHKLITSDKQNDSFAIFITEDSKAGKQFFDRFFYDTDVNVVSSKGNSNILTVIKNNINERLCVLVDGAAFAPYIDEAYKICKNNPNIKIYLPESFEWMILKSNVIKNREIESMLKSPSNFIDITKYFSWEKFFEDKLMELTKGKESNYSKKRISSYYLNDKNMKKIASVIGL